eukprot:CAMPEP_0172309256 /NCGR_PEP_ID=MMETSP1058-20130122/9606_1 /TAXON_ID=83371 /ORGANISM="Detonula confervacea, Strain CCMP 353" /LENGTH=513 /DNA_ID=CAMNT_0013021851 /DNA_START=1 /DNA_END=1542 /DNA_ORIENTATION=-
MQRFIHAASKTAASTPASRRRRVRPPISLLGNYASLSSSTSSAAAESNNQHDPPPTSIKSTIVQRHQRPIYVAATRQHVGKTSVSLALISHFTKRLGTANVGYMKAVGQQSLQVWDEPHLPQTIINEGEQPKEGQYVTIDKDVKLVRDHFRLNHLQYADMSPILIPRGYTKSYLDGEIDHQDQLADIRRAYLNIVKSTSSSCNSGRSITICEGTGHAGVGSVVGAGNARVAAELGADMILVANGGLGKAFDELELNRSLCLQYGVNIAGVIINKVQPDKFDQTRKYLTKAIQQMWTGPNGEPAPPILGVVPDRPYLGCPALADVESTFGTTLISGSDHRYRHYDVGSNLQGRSIGMTMVTTDLAAFLRSMSRQPEGSRTIFICHATRDDVILGFLGEYRRRVRRNIPFESALVICTGCDDGVGDLSNGINFCSEVSEMIKDTGSAGPAVLVASGYSPAEAAKQIRTMTPKFNASDARRVSRATEHYEPYIDFDLLLEQTSSVTEVKAVVGVTA